MKALLRVILFFLPVQALAFPIISYVQLSTGATQSGGFNTSTGTVGSLVISTITSVGNITIKNTNITQPAITISTTGQVGIGYDNWTNPNQFGNSFSLLQSGCNDDNGLNGCDIEVDQWGKASARFVAYSNVNANIAGTLPGVLTYMVAEGNNSTSRYWSSLPSQNTNLMQFQNGTVTMFDQFATTMTPRNTDMYFWNENTSSAAWHWNYGASGTVVAVITSTGSTFQGTTTNDSANTGFYGEYLSSATTYNNRINASATNTYSDVAAVTATAGDWDVTGQVCQTINGAVSTEFAGGIQTVSGNSSDADYGNTLLDGLPATSASDSCRTIANLRKSISSSTTFYLKQYSLYSAGTPKVYGRISARRIR